MIDQDRLQQDVAYYTMEIEGIKDDIAEYRKRIKCLTKRKRECESKLLTAQQLLWKSEAKQ